MRVGLAADHGGFELKEQMIEELRTVVMSTTRMPASGPRGWRAALLRLVGRLVIGAPVRPFLLFGTRESNDRE